MKTYPLLSLLTLLLLSFSACKNDAIEVTCNGATPTYDADIKAILDANCLSSGCHPAGTGNFRGDFSSYAAMEDKLFNGDFEKRVLQVQNMPKGGSLSEAELVLVRCWVDNGYAEN